jgi:hypothetical protein
MRHPSLRPLSRGTALLVALGLPAVTAASAYTVLPMASELGGPVARCQTAQLAIAPDYSEGAAGRASLIFLVHNHAGQTCTLYGYPGAQLLNNAYRGLPTYLRWGGDNTPPRRLVNLAPGADAYFALTWVRIPTAGQSCPAASFVRITPPNAYGSTIVWAGQGGIDACGGALTASPVEPAQFSFGVVPTQ